MSTHIASIEGRYQVIDRESYITARAVYGIANLDITRFYGGKENGSMLQITIQSDKTAYIQLNKEQVMELVEILSNSFGDR